MLMPWVEDPEVMRACHRGFLHCHCDITFVSVAVVLLLLSMGLPGNFLLNFFLLSHMGGQKRRRCHRRSIPNCLNHILFTSLNQQHCLVHVLFPTFSVSSASIFSCALNQLGLWRWANNCGGDEFIHKLYDATRY